MQSLTMLPLQEAGAQAKVARRAPHRHRQLPPAAKLAFLAYGFLVVTPAVGAIAHG